MSSDNKKDNNPKKPQPIDRRELAKLLGRLGVGGAAAAALAFPAPQAQADEPTGGGGCFQACIEDFWREGDGDMSDPNFDWLPLVMRAQREWMGSPGRGFTLNFGPRNYRFNGPIELIRSMNLVGSGGTGWYAGTQLQFPENVPGIICHALWSIVERVRLLGNGGSQDAHGIIMKWRTKLRDVSIQNFGGDGVNIVTDIQEMGLFSVGLEFVAELDRGEVSEALREQFRSHDRALTRWARVEVEQAGSRWWIFDANTSFSVRKEVRKEGERLYVYLAKSAANGWLIDQCRIDGCGGNGIYVHGGDSNAGCAIAVDVADCRGWGIWDDSFLGNTYVGCQVDSGAGQGAYRSGSSNNRNPRNLFLGCYTEGNQRSEFNAPAMVIGGITAASRYVGDGNVMTSGGGPYGASFPAVAGSNARDPNNPVIAQLGSKVKESVALELWTSDLNYWYSLRHAPPGLPGWWQLKWSFSDAVPAAFQFSTDQAPEGAGQFWMPAGCYIGGGPVNY